MLLQPLTLNVGSQAASSTPSPVLNEASVSQPDQQAPSTSAESKLETSSEASTSSNQAIASSTSAASASQPIASDTTHEALTDQADDSATPKRRQKRAVQATSSTQSSPFLVGTAQELAAAIKSGETHIRLTADINIGAAAIPVRQSVIIDGDHKYTYMYNGGLNWHRGIYFAASGIQITFKKLKSARLLLNIQLITTTALRRQTIVLKTVRSSLKMSTITQIMGRNRFTFAIKVTRLFSEAKTIFIRRKTRGQSSSRNLPKPLIFYLKKIRTPLSP